jgi:hypothetical protein
VLVTKLLYKVPMEGAAKGRKDERPLRKRRPLSAILLRPKPDGSSRNQMQRYCCMILERMVASTCRLTIEDIDERICNKTVAKS